MKRNRCALGEIMGWLAISLAVLSACQPTSLTTVTPIQSEMTIPTEAVTATFAATNTPAALATETPRSTVTAVLGEYVVFLECGSDCYEKYISFADPNGALVKRLNLFPPPPGSYFSFDLFDPVPSPDGQFLTVGTNLFYGCEGGCVEGQPPSVSGFYFVDLATSSIITVHTFPTTQGVSWSPDSHKFAFLYRDIHIWDVQSQQLRQIPIEGYSIGEPSWSPDGRYIAFACQRLPTEPENYSTETNLCIMRSDNWDLKVVASQVFVQGDDPNVDFEGHRQTLDWSPDSQWLVYLAGVDQPDIAIVNIVTGEIRLIAASPAKDVNPDWSPDGSRIAFASNRNGKDEIFVIDVNGSNLINLTPNSQAHHFSPIWSPSGQYIAFLTQLRTPDVRQENLIVMKADGSEQVVIAPYLMLFQRRPAWVASLAP